MTVMAKWLFSQLNLLADWEFRNHLNSSNWKPDPHSASEFNSDSVSPLIWPICVATQSPNPMETRSNVFESWCFWAVTLRKILIFHLISSFGNFVERHSFCIVLSEEPKTMRKLCLFHTNFDTRKLGEITVFYVMSWKKNCYAFPPFSLIGTILGKIRTGAK